MKLLSTRARRQLGLLQDDVRRLTAERNTAYRMLLVARVTTTASAQEEFWLEFQWIDQEYRYAVRRLSLFCASFDSQVTTLDLDLGASTVASR